MSKMINTLKLANRKHGLYLVKHSCAKFEAEKTVKSPIEFIR